MGARTCEIVIVRMHARKACKGTKIFSHTQVKTTKFLFLIFSSTSTPLFPYSLRPLSSSLFPRSPYPLFTPKSQYASTHSRYIPDTYPTHTRYIRISHEYSMNTPRIPHEYPIRQKKGKKKKKKRLFSNGLTHFSLHISKKNRTFARLIQNVQLIIHNSKFIIHNS